MCFNGQGNVLNVNSGAAKDLTISFAANTGVNSHQTVTRAQGNITIANDSLIFQIGANRDQTASLGIGKVNPVSLSVAIQGNQFGSLNDIDVTSASKSQDALDVIDAAIDEVTNRRSSLGAFQQNTLESTANNLRTTLGNSVNAESVLRDTDFAEEIANFTKQQVLVQAGTSILANANQSSQLVLSLL